MKNGRNFFVKLGLSIVLSSWLIYTIYWFLKSTDWWPQESAIDFILGSVGTLGLGFRIGAVMAAMLAMVSFLKGKEVSRVRKFVRFAVVLEVPYFMCFIPSAVFGFVAGSELLSGYHTLNQGGFWFIVETAIPTAVESIIMPASLLKLRSKLISASKSHREIVKWACIAGVSYLIVFWLTYFTQWIATFMQPKSYASLYPGYGIEYVLNHPLNMFTFILTSVGLPLLTIFFLWSALPAIRDPAARLNLQRVGITLTLLGFYFITIITLFRVFGYVGGASIWIVFFMFNNPDLWCVTLPVLGIALILFKNPTNPKGDAQLPP
jgi:hypothetical protein